MNKILIPTDFSPNANKALDFAVQIAKQVNAKIIVVHACHLIDSSLKGRQHIYKEYNQGILDKANKNMSYVKKSVEETEKLAVSTDLYNGNVTDTILEAVEQHEAGLIIMGTLGEAGLKEKIFGTVTAGIIGKTNVPVLAVPLLSEWNIPEKILLTINDFEKQPEIFSPVFELAVMFNAGVHIAIFTDIDSAEAGDYLMHKRSIIAYEEKLKTLFKKTDIKSVHLTGHKFQETIEEYILEQHIDILAMVTHKRTFLESIFDRSRTKKMSYHTRIPLLAIPPPIQSDI